MSEEHRGSKIEAGAEKYLVAEVVSDKEHTHRPSTSLIMSLQLFFVCFQSWCLLIG